MAMESRPIEEIEADMAEIRAQLSQLDQQESYGPLESVVLDSLVVLKIVKHSKEAFPDLVTGQLLGLEMDGILEATNCFPFPSRGDDDDAEEYGANYQVEMMRHLKEVNMDNNTVGWYQSTYLGTFLSKSMIETQFNYQDTIPKCVALVYDPLQSNEDTFSLRAFRLTDAFMALYRAGKFSQKTLEQSEFSWSQVFEEVPITIHNPLLSSVYLYELESAGAIKSRPAPAVPFLAKNLEFLIEDIDDLSQEQGKYLNYVRQLARQQQQQQTFLQKRKSDNAQRRADGEEELPEDEPNSSLFKTISSPSRLDSLLMSNQTNQYCDQINQYAGQHLAKLYLYKDLSPAAST